MKLREALRWIWRWSPVVTLPVAATFVFWTIEVANDYRHFGLHFSTLNEYVDLHRIGNAKASYLARQGQLAFRPTITRPAGGLSQIDLFLGRSSEKELNSALPHSGRHYVPGALIYPDGNIWEVKMKYRGDFFWHWSGAKKSLRVKTKKSHLFAGMRAFNLIGSKSKNKLSEQLAYVLGREMDLLAPLTDLVNVSIDGENRGVHFLIEQPEEMLLRRNMRMPGDLYSGDIVARDRYTGVLASLFTHPGQWEKMAINNHFELDSFRVLEELCMAIAEPASAERSARVRELLDIQAFGRFAAYRSIVQSFHYDDHHNWRLYYDPWRNRFEPLLWDPDGWHEGMLPKKGQDAVSDIVTSVLDEVLFEDAEFLVARQIAMEDYFESGKHDALIAELDSLAERSKQSLDYDPSIEHFLVQQSPSEVYAAQAELRAMLQRIGDDLHRAFMTPSTLSYAHDPEDSGRIQLQVDGRRPFTSIDIGFENALEGPLAATLSYWDSRGRRDVDVSGALVRRGARVELNLPVLASYEVTFHAGVVSRLRRQIQVDPGGYELVLAGNAIEGHDLLDIVGVHNNGDRVNAVQVAELEQAPLSQHGAVSPQPPLAPDVWSGTVHIDDVRRITRDVVITPGTNIILAAQASLILEGRTIAIGTKEDPIHFHGAEGATAPWGVVALRGDGAAGSEIAYCVMTGGSGHKEPLAEYTGMFSIHNVPGANIHHCLFQDNFIVDDMVHAVNSKVTFSDCEFKRALADAIDLDMTDGIVERCLFVGAGNDALDLMTANVVLQDSILVGSGDKGVSVGEGTNTLLINVAVRNCLIGVQTKDRSMALLYNCTLEGNDAAIDATQKNWRYGQGGSAFITKSVLKGNGTTLTAAKRSRIEIFDSYLPGEVQESKHIYVDSTVDDTSIKKPNSGDRQEPVRAEMLKHGLFKSRMPHADAGIRGTRGLD